jgi:hypothetical protein
VNGSLQIELLGDPLVALWRGLKRSGQVVLGRLLQPRFVESFALILSTPALCWTVGALTLVG